MYELLALVLALVAALVLIGQRVQQDANEDDAHMEEIRRCDGSLREVQP